MQYIRIKYYFSFIETSLKFFFFRSSSKLKFFQKNFFPEDSYEIYIYIENDPRIEHDFSLSLCPNFSKRIFFFKTIRRKIEHVSFFDLHRNWNFSKKIFFQKIRVKYIYIYIYRKGFRWNFSKRIFFRTIYTIYFLEIYIL